MKTNDLLNAADVFHYDAETGVLTHRKTGHQAGWVNDRGYRIITHQGTNYKAHRIAWLIFHGVLPTGQIDHINQKKDDNRIVNLRDVDSLTNRRNLKRHGSNKSGVMGVCFHKKRKKWRARIKVNLRDIALGEFDRFEDAVAARRVAEAVYGFHENHGQA